MAGSKIGGRKTARTNKLKYGEDYYKNIGKLGGSKKVPKGFAVNKELARIAGAKGGRVSKKPVLEDVKLEYEKTPGLIVSTVKGVLRKLF